MKVGIIGCGNIGLLYAKSFSHYNICKKEDLYLFDKSKEKNKHLAKKYARC
jgi:pyrroline-5-carboxylate reductase